VTERKSRYSNRPRRQLAREQPVIPENPISVLVDQKEADAAVHKLHAYFFREFDRTVFEPPA